MRDFILSILFFILLINIPIGCYFFLLGAQSFLSKYFILSTEIIHILSAIILVFFIISMSIFIKILIKNDIFWKLFKGFLKSLLFL